MIMTKNKFIKYVLRVPESTKKPPNMEAQGPVIKLSLPAGSGRNGSLFGAFLPTPTGICFDASSGTI